MPTLRLRENIGVPEAARLKLPAYAAGSVVEATDEAAEELLARNLAEPARRPAPEPDTLRCVPPGSVPFDPPRDDVLADPMAGRYPRDGGHIDIDESTDEPEPGDGDGPEGGDDAPAEPPRRRRGRPRKDQS